jgi:outer membrane protein assembly factor BamB
MKTRSALALASALAVLAMAICSGCSSKISRCSSDSDCPLGTCDLTVNRCAFLMCDGGAGCPIGAFCNTRLANLCLPIPDGGTNDCVPGCPAYQLCLDTRCQSRYSSIAITQPTDGTFISGAINVVAQLNVNPGFPRSDPSTLTMLIGFDGGTRSGTLSNQGAGMYQGPVIPTQDGPHQLTARYDAANLSSNTVTVIVGGTNCVPACPTHQLCLGGQCQNRYSGIAITQPSDGAFLDGGSPVLAQLIVNPGFPRQDPSTLSLLIGLPDGGAASGTLPILSPGNYGSPGALVPMGDGPYRLTARYDAANLNSNPINVTILTIPPSFILAIPTPPSGPDAGYLNYTDPGLGAPAWRRDQVMQLVIASANQYLVPGTVRLTVTGVGGPNSSHPGVNPTTGCGPPYPYCADAGVDFSLPDMNAFRGTFGLIVTGADRAGNVGTTDGGVVVTRWKWAFLTPDGLAVRTSPAVGSSGTVYVGTSDGTNAGTLYAINPDGTLKWSRSGGWMTSVAVGEVDGGIEAVYAAMNNATLTNLRAINGTDGGDLGVGTFCGPFLGAAIRGSLAVTKIGASETCFAAINSAAAGVMLAMQPSSPLTRCIDGGTASPGGPLLEPAAIAVDNNNNVFFALSSLRIQSLAFNGGWQVRNPPNWPVDAGANNVGLAIVGSPTTQVVGSSTTMGGDGGVFAIAASNGAQTWSFTDAGDPRTAWNPSVATGGTVFFGDEGSKLTSVAIGSSTPTAQVTSAGISRGAPILGNDGTVYIADSLTNAISARSSTSLTPIWSVNTFNGNPFEASLALDCSRDGGVPVSQPGVLYAPDNLRNLFCFVTDSHGIDFLSPWPKYQHDPRNTGNQQTPLGQFGCP